MLHGGGNTSVKIREADLFGEDEDILYVKGSGWDLETIEAAGLLAGAPAATCCGWRRCRALTDPQMVNELRRA